VDEDTIAPDDVAAPEDAAMMGRAKGRRAGKVGELGWDETTDAGRSGLVSRFGKGAFKILHAGGDTYALFFEWDDGRYDRSAAAPPRTMMNLANFKAQDEPPEPPPSHLSLELARFLLRHPGAEGLRAERLEPAIDEARRNTPGPSSRRRICGGTRSGSEVAQREVARYKARKRARKRVTSPPRIPSHRTLRWISSSRIR
jgi:hypothetical protein